MACRDKPIEIPQRHSFPACLFILVAHAPWSHRVLVLLRTHVLVRVGSPRLLAEVEGVFPDVPRPRSGPDMRSTRTGRKMTEDNVEPSHAIELILGVLIGEVDA